MKSRLYKYALFYGLLWFAFSEKDLKALFFGILAVLVAIISHRLVGFYPSGVSFGALLKFSVIFMKEAFLSGVDVARRVLSPSLLVSPGFVVYPLTTQKKPARFMLSLVINLTPGTLTVKMEEDHFLIHTLDTGSFSAESIKKLELLIDRIFT